MKCATKNKISLDYTEPVDYVTDQTQAKIKFAPVMLAEVGSEIALVTILDEREQRVKMVNGERGRHGRGDSIYVTCIIDSQHFGLAGPNRVFQNIEDRDCVRKQRRTERTNGHFT